MGGIDEQREKTAFVFREDQAPGLTTEMSLKKIFHSSRSQFQQIDVIETVFGKTLVTDGKTQSAQFDEFVYHESLIHPALLNFAHNSNNGEGPKTVLIGGGGELATAREVLRYPSVEKCVMVDLDGTYASKHARTLKRRQQWWAGCRNRTLADCSRIGWMDGETGGGSGWEATETANANGTADVCSATGF